MSLIYEIRGDLPNAEGAWKKDGDGYTQTGSGPTLTLNMEMGLGALQLKNK